MANPGVKQRICHIDFQAVELVADKLVDQVDEIPRNRGTQEIDCAAPLALGDRLQQI